MDVDGDSQTDREERRSSMEFTVAQLLKLAVNLDYSDEIGRRKMYGLVRMYPSMHVRQKSLSDLVCLGEMTSQESLPEGLIPRCLDVLRKLSPNERDLIRLVVEVVQELRDLARQDDPEVCHKRFFVQICLCLYIVIARTTCKRRRKSVRRRSYRGR